MLTDFVAKVRDVVGLYVTPPEHASVLCVDEKSQIQALDRTQPRLRPTRDDLAIRRARYCHRPSDRPVLPASSGGRIPPVLDEIEAHVSRDLDVHLIRDNYATPKTALIRDWLAKRPRWHVHSAPNH